MKANKVAILLVTALLVQTQVTEATFFLDFFSKWHEYLAQQQQQQQAPPRQVAVPPTKPTTGGAATGTAAAGTTTATTTTAPRTSTQAGAGATSQAGATSTATAGASATAKTFPNVAAVAVGTPELSTLLEVASAAGLTETLADENLVATAFAPNNAAFAAFLKAYNLTPDQLSSQPDLVRLVLSYHLVPGVAATASQLTDGQELPTQDEGETITVIKKGSSVQLDPTGQNAPNAKVVKADIKAGKAVVHIIDQVLIPANFPLTRGGAAASADATSTAAATSNVVPTIGANGESDTNGAQVVNGNGSAAERAREFVEDRAAENNDGGN